MSAGRIDLDRISEGGTLLEAADNGRLDAFAAAAPATVDDLVLAADWCAAYECGDDSAIAEQMTRAIGYLMREIQAREEARTIRQIQAARPGTSAAAARRAIREHAAASSC